MSSSKPESAISANLSRLRLDEDARTARASKRPWLRIALGVAVLICITLAVLLAHKTPNTAGQQVADRQGAAVSPAERRLPVVVPAAGSKPAATESTTAGGYVEARRTAALVPARAGVVKRVLVKLGQRVEEGALLLEFASEALVADVAMAEAELEVASAQYRLAQAGAREEDIAAAAAQVKIETAELAQASWELARQERLFAGKSATSADVERARTRATVASARLAAAKAKEQQLRAGNREPEIAAAAAEQLRAKAVLARTHALVEEKRLRAPFAGVVVRLDVEPGEAIGPEMAPPIEVADLSELRVRVDVPEGKIVRITANARALVAIDALRGQELEATVVEIAPVANRQSNTVETVVRIHEPPAMLRPNMSARVRIVGEPSNDNK